MLALGSTPWPCRCACADQEAESSLTRLPLRRVPRGSDRRGKPHARIQNVLPPRHQHRQFRSDCLQLRRSLLNVWLAAGGWMARARKARAKEIKEQRTDGNFSIRVPLKWESGGFYLRFCVGNNAAGSENSGSPSRTTFLGVADTGSPFVLVSKCLRKDCASYCAQVGCFAGEGTASEEADSIEGYASGLVEIQWRKQGSVSFPAAVVSSPDNGAGVINDIRFGVQGRVTNFGGTGKAVFFGLVKDHMSDIKTSFLEQTPFVSLSVDLRKPGEESLLLSTTSPSPLPVGISEGTRQRLKLIDPRQWGDPVKHYAAVAKEIRVGGQVVMSTVDAAKPRQVLVIFDTGITGASLTPRLYETYQSMARRNLELSKIDTRSLLQARQMEVVFASESGEDLTLKMHMGKHPVYGSGLDLVTPIDEMAWAGIGPPASLANYKVPGGVANSERPFEDVMPMGLGFLVGKCMMIDTERDELGVIGVL